MLSLLYDIDTTSKSASHSNKFIENLNIAKLYYDNTVIEQEYQKTKLRLSDVSISILKQYIYSYLEANN